MIYALDTNVILISDITIEFVGRDDPRRSVARRERCVNRRHAGSSCPTTASSDIGIISHLLRPSHNHDVVQRFIEETRHNDYVVPPLSYYETLWYLLRKKATAQLRAFEELYKNALLKITMNEAEFIKAAEIRARLEEKGTPIGDKDGDIFIAAYCIVNDYTLVTNNMNDFLRIDGLKLVNWKN